MKKKTIPVEGMHCAMCAKTIENTFDHVQGVRVDVNVSAGKVIATYDETRYTLSDIADKINAAGYKARLDSTFEDDRRHRDRLKKEIFVAIALSSPLLWAMFGHFAWFEFLYVPPLFMDGIFQLVTAGIVQFYLGRRFYIATFHSLKRRVLGMDSLVVLGTTSAYLYSVYLLIGHLVSPAAHPEYFFEISALIITMVLVGNYFEDLAKERTTDALVELVNLGAKSARIRTGDTYREIPIEEVAVGDEIIVYANEKIPVDGTIIEGATHVDESMITGESIPVFKEKNAEVVGATMNLQERIVMEAKRVGDETLLSQIIRTVEEASAEKPPIQRTADRIAAYFVPFVIAISLLNFLLHVVILDFPFTTAFTRSIAILVISCPCALGLATPTSILVGNGMAAKNHILYKGGEFFERAKHIRAVLFDKTGTLTEGKPRITDYEGSPESLSYLYSVSEQSTHPISKAVVEYAKGRTNLLDAENFDTVKGRGVTARVEGKEVATGNKKLMEELGIDIAPYSKQYDEWLEEAKTVNFLAVDGEVEGIYAVRDEIKKTSKSVVNAMKERGMITVMVTGDHEHVAKAIARELGIDRVYAEVLPHEKAKIVQSLQKEGHVTAFVGDGINDAPALKISDVGIAMGYGTDVAIESSDVTLMSHDLGLVLKAVAMSEKTLRNIRQNFFWAFSYNIVAIPLAAAGYLSMLLAAVAMAFSSIAVVMNALRLKTVKLPQFGEVQKGG